MRDLSVGDIAAMLKVAPRTVCKMTDGGTLKSYRLPTSGKDRRVQPKELLEYLVRMKIPVPPELTVKRLCCGCSEPEHTECATLLELGMAAHGAVVSVVLSAASLGRGESLAAAKSLRRAHPAAQLTAILAPDHDAAEFLEWFHGVRNAP